jgi:hypothetical protein
MYPEMPDAIDFPLTTQHQDGMIEFAGGDLRPIHLVLMGMSILNGLGWGLLLGMALWR